jgi:magnesium chelatase subunit H
MTKSVFPGNAASVSAVPINIVIVTMDTHLASATERAYRRLLRDFPGLSLRLYAATEWGTIRRP